VGPTSKEGRRVEGMRRGEGRGWSSSFALGRKRKVGKGRARQRPSYKSEREGERKGPPCKGDRRKGRRKGMERDREGIHPKVNVNRINTESAYPTGVQPHLSATQSLSQSVSELLAQVKVVSHSAPRDAFPPTLENLATV